MVGLVVLWPLFALWAWLVIKMFERFYFIHR